MRWLVTCNLTHLYGNCYRLRATSYLKESDFLFHSLRITVTRSREKKMKIKTFNTKWGERITLREMTREEYLEFRKNMTAQRIAAQGENRIEKIAIVK
jgi:hypothetical protein